MAEHAGTGRLTGTTLHDALRAALAEFDGKATSLLGEAQAAFAGRQDYLETLIALAGNEAWQVASGSTWLLRRHLHDGGRLTPGQTAAFMQALGSLSHWSAVLHACQSVRHLRLEPPQAAEIAGWLAPLQDHQRPFVRAWALDGLMALAGDFEALVPQAGIALAKAQADTAASVRARARNLAAGGTLRPGPDDKASASC